MDNEKTKIDVDDDFSKKLRELSEGYIVMDLTETLMSLPGDPHRYDDLIKYGRGHGKK